MFKTQLKPCAAWGLSQSNIFGLLECRQCKIDVFASFFYNSTKICVISMFSSLVYRLKLSTNEDGNHSVMLKIHMGGNGPTFECLFKSVVSQLTTECIVVFACSISQLSPLGNLIMLDSLDISNNLISGMKLACIEPRQ